MAPHSSTLPWKIPWMEEKVGCSPWDCEESDMTEWLHFHFLLSCIGEGNGNPLQCSCLQNPRDRGTWWAAVYGVTQSWTRLKQLSSSSRRDKEGHYTVIKEPIQEEDVTNVNINALNTVAPQYVRQMLTAINGEINNNTIILGDLNTPLNTNGQIIQTENK